MKTPMEWNTRRLMMLATQGVVITVIVSGLMLLFTSSSDTLKHVREQVRWPMVPLLILPILVSWTCNGTRFFLMSRCIDQPLSYRRAWSIAVSSEFGLAATPGGVGGTAVRLGFLKKSGISLVHGGALLAADLFLDMLFFSMLTPFAIYALINVVDVDKLSLSGNPAWLLLLLIPLSLYLLRNRLFAIIKTNRTAQRVRLAGRLRLFHRNVLDGFRQGRAAAMLIFRNHRGMLALNFMLSAVQFTSRYSVLPLAIWMLGISVNPLPLIVIQGALFMLSMAVVAPGGGGSVEILGSLALTPFIPNHMVGVAVLLWRIFTYHFYLLFGGIVFTVTFRKMMRN